MTAVLNLQGLWSPVAQTVKWESEGVREREREKEGERERLLKHIHKTGSISPHSSPPEESFRVQWWWGVVLSISLSLSRDIKGSFMISGLSNYEYITALLRLAQSLIINLLRFTSSLHKAAAGKSKVPAIPKCPWLVILLHVIPMYSILFSSTQVLLS